MFSFLICINFVVLVSSLGVGVSAFARLIESGSSILVYKLAERFEYLANVVSENQFMFNWIHLVFILSLAVYFSIVFIILGVKGIANKAMTLLGVTGGNFYSIIF